jgi:phosphate transport system substrate-binding protein
MTLTSTRKRRVITLISQAASLWLVPLCLAFAISTAAGEDLRGTLLIVGRGPERAVIEQLAHAFEKAHLGTAIDIKWSRNLRIAEMVTSGEADLAVAGWKVDGLTATTIAWDGLAVIVNFSNPIKELNKQQIASLFSGRIKDWSELDEKANGKVRLVLRPDDQNLTEGFEQTLGIVGQVMKEAERIRSDQNVLRHVSGELDAVGYLSMKAALDAVTYGTSVHLLLVNGVEAGASTVQSGQYPLKRPVVLLMGKKPTALTRAFVDFVLSPAGQRLIRNLYIPLNR